MPTSLSCPTWSFGQSLPTGPTWPFVGCPQNEQHGFFLSIISSFVQCLKVQECRQAVFNIHYRRLRLQKMIDVIAAFCDKWGLIVNLAKSKVMVFRNGGPLRQNEKWFFKGTRVEVVSSYKYLGSIFSPKLVWTLCQKTLAAQARRGLFLLRGYDYATTS